ncbi:MAG: hypothetical protein Tsb0034_07770 [Ekhidna sp.]
MIIHEIQKIVDQFRKHLPEGFVFVLDTTDRSFIYKSAERKCCEGWVLDLDRDQGIEVLTNGIGSYYMDDARKMIGFRNVGRNIFVGFCMQSESNTLPIEPLKSLLENNPCMIFN